MYDNNNKPAHKKCIVSTLIVADFYDCNKEEAEKLAREQIANEIAKNIEINHGPVRVVDTFYEKFEAALWIKEKK